MKLSLFGRLAMALFASLALGLGMTACGGGTIGYLWVLGQQYNQIAGFKIDDYTGNLTDIVGAPFASNGSNPISIALKPGGRYIFVVNQGTGGSSSANGAGASVAVYSVGGDGTLTFQQSYQPQGYIPVWAQIDTTGSYLYVLTKYSPGYDTANGLWDMPNTDGLGAITVFSIDPNTARLSLVTNSAILKNGVSIPFFEVGAQPLMMKTFSGCVFTLNQADNTLSLYSVGSSGQLTIPTTGKYQVNTTGTISSVNGGGSYLFLTDSKNDQIFQYTVGTGCTPTPAGSNILTQSSQVQTPVWTLVDSSSKYLYVLNQSTTVTQPGTAYSLISAYTINPSNGQLQPITGSPYTVGAGPVCMVEDPTNQYMYISNYNDGTVTGKLLDPTTGILSQLSRGSTFPAVGQAKCLVVSGSVS